MEFNFKKPLLPAKNIRIEELYKLLPAKCGLTPAKIAKLNEQAYAAFISSYCESDVQKLNHIRKVLLKKYKTNARISKNNGVHKNIPDKKAVESFLRKKFSAAKKPVDGVIQDFANEWFLELEDICVMEHEELLKLLKPAKEEEKDIILRFRHLSICRYHAGISSLKKKNALQELNNQKRWFGEKIDSAMKVIDGLKLEIKNLRQTNAVKILELQSAIEKCSCGEELIARITQEKLDYDLFLASCDIKDKLSGKKLEGIRCPEVEKKKIKMEVEFLAEQLAFNNIQKQICNSKNGVIQN